MADYKVFPVLPIILNTPKPASNGYPNNVANTQTLKVRGTGAATKGTGCSTKMG